MKPDLIVLYEITFVLIILNIFVCINKLELNTIFHRVNE